MKFYHRPGFKNKGGVTVLYNIISTEKGKFVEIAIAQCSDKDQYNKKIGRELAINRYLAKEVFVFSVKGSEKSIRERIRSNMHWFAISIHDMQSSHKGI